MVELTELNGVAEGRAENLEEAGYEEAEDLVGADAEAVAEEVSYLPEDTALELIVQAQDLVEDESDDESDSSPDVEDDTITNEESPVTESDATDDDSDEEDDSVAAEQVAVDTEPNEANSEEVQTIEFTLTFDEPLEYETLFDAALEERANYYRTNRTGVEAYEHALQQLRNATPEDEVEFEFTPDQLNDLHNSVRNRSIEYKGDNLIDHMDAMKRVLNQIDEVRSEHLF